LPPSLGGKIFLVFAQRSRVPTPTNNLQLSTTKPVTRLLTPRKNPKYLRYI
jgi:hypothetical protein